MHWCALLRELHLCDYLLLRQPPIHYFVFHLGAICFRCKNHQLYLKDCKWQMSFVIDEMSMMTSYMLFTVEHRLKQAARSRFPNALWNKPALLVGDLAQLPAICIHSPKSPDILCRGCHITSAPCWATPKHHSLRMSVRHATDPTYLQFLKIIRERVPKDIEIKTTLS